MHRERIFDTFEYGAGADQVELRAWVPLDVCNECGEKFNTEEADQIRHDEICRHLQLLTPREILGVRVAHQLSKTRFAEVTGIGIASLSRWESGQLLQSRSHDNLLRLMESKMNKEFLERLGRKEVSSIKEMEKPLNKVEPRVLAGQRLSTAVTASSLFDLRKVG
jgi:putative zinc finger/helix-turn-helix YgiT family protein